mmetsp:Transcript_31056/g.42065  ORF Transcript_31056/g.42065 Transcript_31056/m.42065 type:complete len:404 (-) Transcript_31056:169-1380(-)
MADTASQQTILGSDDFLTSSLEVKSLRNCGVNPKGTLQNGRTAHKAQMNRAPSIPSKFETGLLVDGEKTERNAFGARTHRFVETESSGPGPGHYTHQGGAPPLIRNPMTCGSVSLRGYGNLASKSQRFDERRQRENTLDPGPGAYVKSAEGMKGGHTNHSTARTSRAFASPTKGFHREEGVLPAFVRPSATPGPGTYHNEKTMNSAANCAVSRPHTTSSSHQFRSSCARFSSKMGQSIAPGPGAYDAADAAKILDNQGSLAAVLSSFASKSQRKGIRGGLEPEETPGPGQYDEKKCLKALRRADEPNERKSSAVFGDVNQDRFGCPYDHKIERLIVPGPGAYEDGMQSANSSKSNMSLSSMKSRSARIQPPQRKQIIPGPAFYKPTVIDKKTFTSVDMPRRWS